MDQRSKLVGQRTKRVGWSVGQSNDELIASPSRDEIKRPHIRNQGARDGCDHLVTMLMSERVVNLLEAVDIQEYRRERPAVTPQFLEPGPDDNLRKTTVCNPAQCVDKRDLAQLLQLLHHLDPV